MSVIVGVDGGGTHASLVAISEIGEVLARAGAEGVNYNTIGLEAARRNLAEGVARLGLRRAPDVLAVGSAALDDEATEAECARFAGEAFPGTRVIMHSDAYMALMGMTLGGGGAMAIAGTGSMVVALDGEGRQRVAGGWGYLLGDAGSGYAISVGGLVAAIEAWEAQGGEATALCRAALAHFGAKSPREIISAVYPAYPSELAKFAVAVIACAEAGDARALDVVRGNMERLARDAARLMHDMGEKRIGLYGGVFQHSALAREMFMEALAARMPGAKGVEAEFPPEIGAALYALKREGGLKPDVVARLRATFAR